MILIGQLLELFDRYGMIKKKFFIYKTQSSETRLLTIRYRFVELYRL